ncbi:hypothetical protein [Polaromonas sp. SM01]|uniref:hypothetical protein n=1 Tax=Polaromonas sp. SM01 TaxID=3085630 RepID=UPI002981426A|nr:hypothetical protein [Polaromonas sp. SM01]MDW5443498.1 hypothetical protein [Polaromonas sp. SM01]
MRHLLLVLMIVLLPLRGWVGDVMATEMAAPRLVQVQAAMETVADHADTAGASTHFYHASAPLAAAQATPDCAGHDAGDSAPSSDAHCASCALCQACHIVALSPPAAQALPVLSPFMPPHSPVASFASADTALGQKPPIS